MSRVSDNNSSADEMINDITHTDEMINDITNTDEMTDNISHTDEMINDITHTDEMINKITHTDEMINDNDDNDIIKTVKILLMLLQIGLISDYLPTNAISSLLSSSHFFNNFKGFSSDIIDRVMIESFKANKSLSLCKLFKSASSLTVSSIPLSSLGNIVSRQVLISQIPEKPLSLIDLKTAYLTVKKCKCCFELIDVTTVDMPDVNPYPLVAVKVTLGSDRAINLIHLALETDDHEGKYTICPSFCEICEGYKCIQCNPVDSCSVCSESKCRQCADFSACAICNKKVCEDCLENQFGSGYCDSCDEFYCEQCSLVSFCEICEQSLCLHKCGPVQFCEACEKTKCIRCEPMLFCEKCYNVNCMDCSIGKMFFCIDCGKCSCIKCDPAFAFCGKCYQTRCMSCSFKTMSHCNTCWESKCMECEYMHLDINTFEFTCISCFKKKN